MSRAYQDVDGYEYDQINMSQGRRYDGEGSTSSIPTNRYAPFRQNVARQGIAPFSHVQHPVRFVRPIPVLANSQESRLVTKYPNIVIRDSKTHLSQAEYQYLDSVDPMKPFLANIQECISKNVIDTGKVGIVILKHQLASKLDDVTYEESCRSLAHFQLRMPSNGSNIGELSPKVFQLGMSFFLNINVEKTEKKLSKSEKPHILFTPVFKSVTKEWSGTHPFKNFQSVSTVNCGVIPEDIQRGVAYIIREVLCQILDHPTIHQTFAVRAGDKNAKSSHSPLPADASDFIQDYCLESYGYSPSMKLAGFNLEQLSIENPSLAERLGATVEERRHNFHQLLDDVANFNRIIFQKLQRTMHDLRKCVLQDKPRFINGKKVMTKGWISTNVKTTSANPKNSNHSTQPLEEQEATNNDDHLFGASSGQVDDMFFD